MAIAIVARLPVIDPVAVTHVEPKLGAIPPDRVLYEPRENSREGRIEASGVDLLGRLGNNVGAPTWLVAGRAIRMLGAEPGQDASADQEIVHQCVDGNHAGANLAPGLEAPRS